MAGGLIPQELVAAHVDSYLNINKPPHEYIDANKAPVCFHAFVLVHRTVSMAPALCNIYGTFNLNVRINSVTLKYLPTQSKAVPEFAKLVLSINQNKTKQPLRLQAEQKLDKMQSEQLADLGVLYNCTVRS